MRFVITIEDVIIIALFAVGILLIIIGCVGSWLRNMGEWILDKTTKSRAKGADDERIR